MRYSGRWSILGRIVDTDDMKTSYQSYQRLEEVKLIDLYCID